MTETNPPDTNPNVPIISDDDVDKYRQQLLDLASMLDIPCYDVTNYMQEQVKANEGKRFVELLNELSEAENRFVSNNVAEKIQEILAQRDKYKKCNQMLVDYKEELFAILTDITAKKKNLLDIQTTQPTHMLHGSIHQILPEFEKIIVDLAELMNNIDKYKKRMDRLKNDLSSALH